MTPSTTTPSTTTTRNEDGQLVTGLFPDRASAEAAYGAATERGYSRDDVNLVMSDETRATHFGDQGTSTELGNKAAEGAGIGGAIGGTVGAIAAAIAAVGTSLVLPGVGLVVAGPIAAALAGAGAGAAGGGLVGALIGLEHPRGARDALRRRHQEGRHPDGPAHPQRRGCVASGNVLEVEQRAARVPLTRDTRRLALRLARGRPPRSAGAPGQNRPRLRRPGAPCRHLPCQRSPSRDSTSSTAMPN